MSHEELLLHCQIFPEFESAIEELLIDGVHHRILRQLLVNTSPPKTVLLAWSYIVLTVIAKLRRVSAIVASSGNVFVPLRYFGLFKQCFRSPLVFHS